MDKSALFLEESFISGDTMIEMNHSLNTMPKGMKKGSYYLHDIMAQFALLIQETEREKLIRSLIDLDFDTEYALQKFRETQADYFDEEGKSYRGNIISHSTMELMFKIINGFDNYAKSIRED